MIPTTRNLQTDQPLGDDYEARPVVNCIECLDTGARPLPHSDEATETCDCPAGDRLHLLRTQRTA
jgi:hypothetical protein